MDANGVVQGDTKGGRAVLVHMENSASVYFVFVEMEKIRRLCLMGRALAFACEDVGLHGGKNAWDVACTAGRHSGDGKRREQT
ncbi:hypothetical protein E4U43_004197, partial [Claviceps pusilla]